MGVQYTATEEDIEEWHDIFVDGAVGTFGKFLNVDDGPEALIARHEPGSVIERHYHTENQWQIILEGSCTIEGERLEPYAVHFTEAGTSYGPIVAGEDGLTFMTLRERPAGYHPDTEE